MRGTWRPRAPYELCDLVTDASTSQHAVLLTTAAGIALVACVFADVVPVLAAVTVAGIVAWGAARWVGVPASSIEAPALSISDPLVFFFSLRTCSS